MHKGPKRVPAAAAGPRPGVTPRLPKRPRLESRQAIVAKRRGRYRSPQRSYDRNEQHHGSRRFIRASTDRAKAAPTIRRPRRRECFSASTAGIRGKTTRGTRGRGARGPSVSEIRPRGVGRPAVFTGGSPARARAVLKEMHNCRAIRDPLPVSPVPARDQRRGRSTYPPARAASEGSRDGGPEGHTNRGRRGEEHADGRVRARPPSGGGRKDHTHRGDRRGDIDAARGVGATRAARGAKYPHRRGGHRDHHETAATSATPNAGSGASARRRARPFAVPQETGRPLGPQPPGRPPLTLRPGERAPV